MMMKTSFCALAFLLAGAAWALASPSRPLPQPSAETIVSAVAAAQATVSPRRTEEAGSRRDRRVAMP